nr:PPC domain-containing protein [Candidatus Sigynarchaeota archaeon]
LTITMDSITASDPDLQLYNSGQTLLASSANSGTTTETISYLTTSSGYYYIRAFPFSGLPSYRLIISTVADDFYEENDAFASAAYISTGSTYNNLRGFDDDWFQVYINAGTILNVSISITNSQYLSVYLYNSGQSTLASDGSSTSSLFMSYLITTSGYYYIQTVPGYGYRPYYSLTTTTASDDYYEENDAISSAASISTGTIYGLKAFDDDWYKIYVNAGNTLNVSLTKYGSGYAYLYLYNPSESLLASWTGTATLQTLTYHVTSAGYYYIKVDYSGGGTPSYDLSASITQDPTPPGPVVDGYNMWMLAFCVISVLAVALRFKGKMKIFRSRGMKDGD